MTTIYNINLPSTPSLGDLLNSTMMFGMDQYLQEEEGGFKATWDKVQQSKHCCGITNYTDWGSAVPSSCYENNGNDVYTRGCFDIVMSDVSDDIYTIFGSCVSFVVLEMFAIAVIISTS